MRGAGFVQESGPERLDVKHRMIAEIEAAAPPDAIIASSSSGLPVSEMQRGARHPERIVLGHPFNPPHLIPLVEQGVASVADIEAAQPWRAMSAGLPRCAR